MLTESLIFYFKKLFSESANLKSISEQQNSCKQFAKHWLFVVYKKHFFCETEFTWKSFRAFPKVDSRKKIFLFYY